MPSGDFFTTSEQNLIAVSIAAAEASCDLSFSLFVGELEEGRKDAIKLHKSLDKSSATVLVCVDLQNHAIEIVTGSYASATVDNQACRLAAVAMANAFTINDFAGGLNQAFAVLGAHAYRPKSMTDV